MRVPYLFINCPFALSFFSPEPVVSVLHPSRISDLVFVICFASFRQHEKTTRFRLRVATKVSDFVRDSGRVYRLMYVMHLIGRFKYRDNVDL